MACVWCINNDQSVVEVADSHEALEEGKVGLMHAPDSSDNPWEVSLNELVRRTMEDGVQAPAIPHSLPTQPPRAPPLAEEDPPPKQGYLREAPLDPATQPPRVLHPHEVARNQLPEVPASPSRPTGAAAALDTRERGTSAEEPKKQPRQLPRCIMRIWKRIEQQHEPTVLMPLWLGQRPAQASCGLFCTLLFLIVGGLLVAASSTIPEVIVSYKAGDVEQRFTVSDDISGDVLVWYELPQVFVNQKRFVENRDTKVYPTIMSKVHCDSATDLEDIRWRRAGDPHFLSLISGLEEFRPCGLVALSMFTDAFAVFQSDGSAGWSRKHIDETDLALPEDRMLFSGKINEGQQFTIGGVRSWLVGGAFYEHFKVWYRTPAAPHVRNLWGTIKGGLPAGTYKVEFPTNSPIWEHWGVPEKRIIFSRSHTLGSSGAVRLVGIFMLALGSAEALVVLTFAVSLVLPRRKTA